MDHGFSTFSINTIEHNQFIDPNEYFNQQKEIDGILSNAFDDITSIQPISDPEDDNNDNNKQSTKINSINTSTPLNNYMKTNGKSKYLRNISNIIEENTLCDVESIDNDDLHSNISLSDHNNNDNDLQLKLNELVSSRNYHDLLDNDVQLKDLCFLKQQFSQINSNYEMLQSKYQKLHQLNDENINTIELLQSKIKSLEKQLKDEKESKESERRKASIFESKVNSLEYQLNELKKGDYLSKNNEEQIKWFEALKLRHQKELNDLRNNYELKIDTLTQTINSKEEELISNCNIILKYKQEATYFRDKIQTNEKEMKYKLQKEIDNAKRCIELNLLKSFDDSIKKLKIEWEQKLLEDINRIVHWFENWEDDDQQESIEKLDVRFEKLIDLCDALKRSTSKREQQIQTQIDRMEEAKRQLEKAIIEARLRNSSISSTSSRSDLLLEENISHPANNPVPKKLSHPESNDLNGINAKSGEEKNKIMANLRLKYEKELKDIREQFESELDLLRIKLLNKEEEASLLKRKSNKYKQYYVLLVDKHKQELSLLKNEFTKVMQDLMNNKKV